jgi:hypothetical protein
VRLPSSTGQTASKTRNFLQSNLEKVVLLDEAYSLTTYESKSGDEQRTLSAYSAEAVTEVRFFMATSTLTLRV